MQERTSVMRKIHTISPVHQQKQLAGAGAQLHYHAALQAPSPPVIAGCACQSSVGGAITTWEATRAERLVHALCTLTL